MTAEEIKKVIRRAFTRHMVQHVQVARGDVRDRVDLFIDEATDELLTEFASQKDASKELEILKSIKSIFTVQSDNSTLCNGYKRLCQIIKDKELPTPPND